MSAANQRTLSFINLLEADGFKVLRLGGRFSLAKKDRMHGLLREIIDSLRSIEKYHIVTAPPYKSCIFQLLILYIFKPRTSLILDQRDIALPEAPRFERLVEWLLLNRASLVIVTTHAQRRLLKKRYEKLPMLKVVRNGSSLYSTPLRSIHNPVRATKETQKLRIIYQGLVGGKSLSSIVHHLSLMDCDVVLAVFVDDYSREEINYIRRELPGPGKLEIYENLSRAELVRLIQTCDIALNPIPSGMNYAFTVKTADYALCSIPQLVIASSDSVTGRIVSRLQLGTTINDIKLITNSSLQLLIDCYHKANHARASQLMRRDTHALKLMPALKRSFNDISLHSIS